VPLLLKTGASLVVTRPSTAIGILETLPELSPLRLISTVGEMVQPELHQLLKRLPSCRHFDTYGSVETGAIAIACSKCGSYHLADQHLIVEVLDEGGTPAPAGTIGRVIATPLYNLAMPLLRYETGDYAIPQSNIACQISGRGLSEIVGRSLNLFLLPDGSRVTPRIANDDLVALGIRKHKMIQVSRVQIDFLYVPISQDITLNAESVQILIDRNISPLIQARPVRVEEIGPGANGKYLMHESLVSRS
jgi:phenylacetate-CoA ligase